MNAVERRLFRWYSTRKHVVLYIRSAARADEWRCVYEVDETSVTPLGRPAVGFEDIVDYVVYDKGEPVFPASLRDDLPLRRGAPFRDYDPEAPVLHDVVSLLMGARRAPVVQGNIGNDPVPRSRFRITLHNLTSQPLRVRRFAPFELNSVGDWQLAASIDDRFVKAGLWATRGDDEPTWIAPGASISGPVTFTPPFCVWVYECETRDGETILTAAPVGFPGLESCMVLQGLALIDNGWVERAWQIADSLDHVSDISPEAVGLRGAVRLARGEYDRALDDFLAAMALDPDIRFVRLGLVRAIERCDLLRDREGADRAGKRGAPQSGAVCTRDIDQALIRWGIEIERRDEDPEAGVYVSLDRGVSNRQHLALYGSLGHEYFMGLDSNYSL